MPWLKQVHCAVELKLLQNVQYCHQHLLTIASYQLLPLLHIYVKKVAFLAFFPTDRI
ncbi:hypothetical protein HanPSC8_Chr13g0592531 [Helianthus annuus]|nr:hypothetical protein HanPSC8_Chr13g0592531 [Helianthus annuus]